MIYVYFNRNIILKIYNKIFKTLKFNINKIIRKIIFHKNNYNQHYNKIN